VTTYVAQLGETKPCLYS